MKPHHYIIAALAFCILLAGGAYWAGRASVDIPVPIDPAHFIDSVRVEQENLWLLKMEEQRDLYQRRIDSAALVIRRKPIKSHVTDAYTLLHGLPADSIADRLRATPIAPNVE